MQRWETDGQRECRGTKKRTRGQHGELTVGQSQGLNPGCALRGELHGGGEDRLAPVRSIRYFLFLVGGRTIEMIMTLGLTMSFDRRSTRALTAGAA